MTPALRMTDIRKSFSEADERRCVLNGVDLELEFGRLGVVTGVSGRGKSTLLAIAGGLMAPDQGSVQVAGVDVGSMSCIAPRWVSFSRCPTPSRR